MQLYSSYLADLLLAICSGGLVNGYLTNNWLIPPTAIWHQVDVLLKLLINDMLVMSSYFNSQLAVRCYWVNASACATLAIVSYVE